ncbi:hypothetical protein [[Actinomadura] parvosata]|nr:hypothetical protein [Nonomuraea sp. ATCC 55076]
MAATARDRHDLPQLRRAGPERGAPGLSGVLRGRKRGAARA